MPQLVGEPIVELPSARRQQHNYSDNADDFVEIPIGELDGYLASLTQPAAATQSSRPPIANAPETPSAGMSDIDFQGILGLLGSLLGNTSAPSVAPPANVQAMVQSLPHDGEALQFVAKRHFNPKPFGRLGHKTTELIGNQPPRRRVVAMGGVAVIAALAFGGSQYDRGPVDQAPAQLTARASLINQGAVIASVKLASETKVRVPVGDFKKPLLFKKKGQAVEPTATLNDTISITLAPRLDKKGNALPIAIVKNGDTFVINRSNIDVIANFDNYLGLNIDCIKQATTVNRYCVEGSPVKLQAGGKLSVKTANQLNDLLTTQGSKFDTFYEGVKAKLAVAGLAKVEQGTCGTEIFGLADQVIKTLLQKQSATAKIRFIPNSHYPSISQDFAANFTSLVKDPAFSIERGDTSYAVPDSLQVTCKVTPPITKGAKK